MEIKNEENILSTVNSVGIINKETIEQKTLPVDGSPFKKIWLRYFFINISLSFILFIIVSALIAKEGIPVGIFIPLLVLFFIPFVILLIISFLLFKKIENKISNSLLLRGFNQVDFPFLRIVSTIRFHLYFPLTYVWLTILGAPVGSLLGFTNYSDLFGGDAQWAYGAIFVIFTFITFCFLSPFIFTSLKEKV